MDNIIIKINNNVDVKEVYNDLFIYLAESWNNIDIQKYLLILKYALDSNNNEFIHYVLSIGINIISYDVEIWAKWVHHKCYMHEYTNIKVSSTEFSLNFILELEKQYLDVNVLFSLRHLFIHTNEDHLIQRKYYQDTILFLNNTYDLWINSKIINPVGYLPFFSSFIGFKLTYHNYNNSFLLYETSRLYKNLLKHNYNGSRFILNYSKYPTKQKKRIGFYSRFLHTHSIGKFIIGIIVELYKLNEFDIYVFTSDKFLKNDNDCLRKILKDNCDNFIIFNTEVVFDNVSDMISAKLDILVFIDPLMDIQNYIISNFRIAPIQITSWGHPDTTGIINMDYYISSSIFESNNDVYYTEKLVQLPCLNMYYYPLKTIFGYDVLAEINSKTKQEIRKTFELPIDAHLYGFPCYHLKFSKEMYEILENILHKDKNAYIINIMDWNEDVYKKSWDKMYNAFKNKDLTSRILHIPYITNTVGYLTLISSFDLILDPFPFGGLISTMEQFELGLPVVCMEGNKLYNRFTAGLYKIMGITDLIVNNINDYVDRAIFVATHPTFHTNISARISNNYWKLLEQKETINEWAKFLHSL